MAGNWEGVLGLSDNRRLGAALVVGYPEYQFKQAVSRPKGHELSSLRSSAGGGEWWNSGIMGSGIMEWWV